MDILLKETRIPVHDAVDSVCETLGYDPLYLACEGRVVAVVSPEASEKLLKLWQQHPLGAAAAIIGQFEQRSETPKIILETELGGKRLLQELEDDPLPRIC